MSDNPPAKQPIIKKLTGETFGTLAWMAIGAAVGAALLAPMVMKWLGLSYDLALIVSGAACALLSGALRAAFKGKGEGVFNATTKIAHGAVIFGVGLFGANLLAPMLQRIPWFGRLLQTAPAHDPDGPGPATMTGANADPALVGLVAT